MLMSRPISMFIQPKLRHPVIPAKAGIQSYYVAAGDTSSVLSC